MKMKVKRLLAVLAVVGAAGTLTGCSSLGDSVYQRAYQNASNPGLNNPSRGGIVNSLTGTAGGHGSSENSGKD